MKLRELSEISTNHGLRRYIYLVMIPFDCKLGEPETDTVAGGDG
eukprot:CAMPEP_0198705668 /NCGR_PEP_ID=MMETSP1468-20131203/390547_1 /TAXON_ID=1461545 /ORGANISM="Mantoniella sp, Strain CCMP1436" /LENGTH=43 /DNA_ID= /DNA_START= /DNA_END= /DNA_ORIENTATION=